MKKLFWIVNLPRTLLIYLLTKTVDRERSSLKIWNGLHMVKGKTKGHTERFQK